MPLISVVVPVYKVEAYLDRCVQSILEQTIEDFELILVDDGSPDNCGAMCDAWAAKDNRIQVIHKENGGLSDARNAGVGASCGEWITFVDSDDYIHPQMLEALYAAVQEHGVKLSACNHIKTHGEPLRDGALTSALWDSEEFYCEKNINAAIACAKLYHKSVVRPYPVGKLHEDEYVTYRIVFDLGKVAAIDTPLYGYFQNSQSIMQETWNPKRMDAMGAFEEQIAYFTQRGMDRMRRRQLRGYLQCVMAQLSQIQGNPAFHGPRRSLVKQGRKLLRQCRKEKLIYGEQDAWMYKLAYPRVTGFVFMCKALFKKLGIG